VTETNLPDWPGELSHDIVEALDDVSIPSYVIDPNGVIRWLNRAALDMVGDVRGRQFTSVIVPEDTRRTRESFTRMMLQTTRITDDTIELRDRTGGRIRVEYCAVSLVDGHKVIGIFGQIPRYEVETPPREHPHLTPRQLDVLGLLERGYSTHQIAEELHISSETVRNHIRHLMRALGVHSRLQAVVVAKREHLASSGALA
jgi:PAS domain S-box-containing protein